MLSFGAEHKHLNIETSTIKVRVHTTSVSTEWDLTSLGLCTHVKTSEDARRVQCHSLYVEQTAVRFHKKHRNLDFDNMFFARRRNAESALTAQNVTDSARHEASTGGASLPPHPLASVLLFNPSLKPASASGTVSISGQCDGAAAASAPDIQLDEAEQEAKVVYTFGGGFAPEDVRNQAGLLEGLIAFTKYVYKVSTRDHCGSVQLLAHPRARVASSHQH